MPQYDPHFPKPPSPILLEWVCQPHTGDFFLENPETGEVLGAAYPGPDVPLKERFHNYDDKAGDALSIAVIGAFAQLN